jgi:hypothetical protein
VIKTTRVQTNARARSPGGDAHPACRCLSRNAWLLIAEEYSAHEPGQLPIRQNSRFWVSATSGTLIVLGIPNGGYLRGPAKTEVALRDELPSASVLGPLSAEFRLPTGHTAGSRSCRAYGARLCLRH